MQEVIEHLDAALRALKESPELSIHEALPIQDRLGRIIGKLGEKAPSLGWQSEEQVSGSAKAGPRSVGRLRVVTIA